MMSRRRQIAHTSGPPAGRDRVDKTVLCKYCIAPRGVRHGQVSWAGATLPFRVRAILLLSELAKSVQTRSDGVVEPWRGELRRGLERLRDGEFADAEAHFARAHRMAPDRAEVCFALGRERLRRGDFDQAEVLLRQAWQLDPSLVSAAAFLARCLGVDRREFAAA